MEGGGANDSNHRRVGRRAGGDRTTGGQHGVRQPTQLEARRVLAPTRVSALGSVRCSVVRLCLFGDAGWDGQVGRWFPIGVLTSSLTLHATPTPTHPDMLYNAMCHARMSCVDLC